MFRTSARMRCLCWIDDKMIVDESRLDVSQFGAQCPRYGQLASARKPIQKHKTAFRLWDLRHGTVLYADNVLYSGPDAREVSSNSRVVFVAEIAFYLAGLAISNGTLHESVTRQCLA